MPEIKYVGKYAAYVFDVDDVPHGVNMTRSGEVVVIKEPGITLGTYPKWEEFAISHPEFAEIIQKDLQAEINETIDLINRARFVHELQEIVVDNIQPAPERDDRMFHDLYRSYQ
jgi:hypothetical protein